jgi:hypothetical protein
MADAMKAQMEMLTGKTLEEGEGFEELYASALGKEGGTLADIMRKFEAPLRKETAQIDTDVMRQTILGGSQKVVQDESGEWGIREGGAFQPVDGRASGPGGEFFLLKGELIDGATGNPVSQADFLVDNGYMEKVINKKGVPIQIGDDQYYYLTEAGEASPYAGMFTGRSGHGANKLIYEVDGELKPGVGTVAYNKMSEEEQSRYRVDNGIPQNQPIPDSSGAAKAMFDEVTVGVQQPDFKETTKITTIDPGTGKKYKEGDVVREGTGMIDLLGDTRAVQESVRSEDYAQYVQDNPDLQAAFKQQNNDLQRQGLPQKSIEEWGQEHYEKDGKDEGRELSTSYSLQDAGRQAGFDESGQFRGLSALAEDIGRGGQQRAREADIADVERLGGRATEAYRAQGDLSGALAQARGIGAGGAQGLSAIPSDPLFTGDATGSLADRTAAENLGIDAITSGGMQYAMARPADALAAATSYDPSVGIAGGQIGADTLRTALMSDAETSLAGGLTQREERQISEAAKAQQTMMGRTFDQSAAIAEARARTLEDRNRQALNRQYAQQVLGQEAGLQQSDLGRGLQASLANQQAANQAAQYGVGAGLQREQVGAQLDQQTALANQAAKQEAARYTAQEAMQAQQMELGRQSAGVDRQLTAEEKDIERLMRQQAMEEQYRQQGLGAERASAAQMVGLEQATSADPFQAILQRQGQNNLASGGALFGQAGYGLQSGPQYLNPEAGLGFIQNQATNAANMFGAQQAADATRSAGMMGGIGSALGGIGSGLFSSMKPW